MFSLWNLVPGLHDLKMYLLQYRFRWQGWLIFLCLWQLTLYYFFTLAKSIVILAKLFEFFESLCLKPYLWTLNKYAKFLCCIFWQQDHCSFLAWRKLSFYFPFFHKIGDFTKFFQEYLSKLAALAHLILFLYLVSLR